MSRKRERCLWKIQLPDGRGGIGPNSPSAYCLQSIAPMSDPIFCIYLPDIFSIPLGLLYALFFRGDSHFGLKLLQLLHPHLHYIHSILEQFFIYLDVEKLL